MIQDNEQGEQQADGSPAHPYPGTEYVTAKGHHLDSAHGKCIRCGEPAINLYEDAMYGPVRECIHSGEQ